MAQIRARYDGPHEEVLVIHPETNKLLDRVERGKWLSADVPASIRDEADRSGQLTAVEYNPARLEAGRQGW
jgi:hypothetical protein